MKNPIIINPRAIPYAPCMEYLPTFALKITYMEYMGILFMGFTKQRSVITGGPAAPAEKLEFLYQQKAIPGGITGKPSACLSIRS